LRQHAPAQIRLGGGGREPATAHRTRSRHIRRKLAEIEDVHERAAVDAEARRTAERIVDARWLDLSRIALRLEQRRRLNGDELHELLAELRRVAS
jgi:hypothetical protein